MTCGTGLKSNEKCHGIINFSIASRLKHETVLRDCFFGYSTRPMVAFPATIDRVDNAQGYKKSNVVGCCSRCNEMKGSKPLEEFLNTARKVFTHIYKNE